MTEEIFFETEDVKVTNARFIVGNHTYAMNGVTSVKSTLVPANHNVAIVLIVIGIIALLAASGGGKLFGMLLIAAGIAMIFLNKPTYAVTLHSASGEAQALASHDEHYISSVIEALNQSLIHRG